MRNATTRAGLLASAAILLGSSPAFAEAERFDAILVGHAALPAESVVTPPADAPAALQVSGKFTNGAVRNLEAPSDAAALPMLGQPLQGFSGIRAIGDGSYWVLTDNGFGSRPNSPDAMLFFNKLRPDFDTGEIAVEANVFLHDPDQVVPYPITMEGTEERYLTGADFDLEGFQVVGDHIVIGDEFGPYVIAAELETGKVVEFHETYVDGELVMSPDHHALRLPNPGDELPAYDARRSRGYEGFAASVDGSVLYPLLEGPLWDHDAGDHERVEDGRAALRLLEMDAATRAWSGRSWLYPIEDDSHAIGDFNMIDATRGLVIERDGGQGDAELACPEGTAREDAAAMGCFDRPAMFKRVYLIDMAGVEPGGMVHKVGYIDLLDIQDPKSVARVGAREDGRFTFPFVTIENVDMVDETHIIVGNDNNYPFSTGRVVDAPDMNEMILLEVGDLLAARAPQ